MFNYTRCKHMFAYVVMPQCVDLSASHLPPRQLLHGTCDDPGFVQRQPGSCKYWTVPEPFGDWCLSSLYVHPKPFEQSRSKSIGTSDFSAHQSLLWSFQESAPKFYHHPTSRANARLGTIQLVNRKNYSTAWWCNMVQPLKSLRSAVIFPDNHH